ncbi:MAG: flagellar protein FlaG [Planctomycetes bacterium]|nr:flagellar protein FlaG [Planctomycetota bacterium]
MAEPISLVELSSVTPRASETAAQIDRATQASSSAVAEQEIKQATQLDASIKELEKSKTEEEPLTERQKNALKEAFRELNSVMDNFRKSIRFAIFEQSGDLYAQVINVSTDEVVKTIPSEEAMEVMARINEVVGMLIDAEG